jgi:hypothetical protein
MAETMVEKMVETMVETMGIHLVDMKVEKLVGPKAL